MTLGTLVKTTNIPHIKATPGKTKKFNIPLEITVNSQLIRRLTVQNNKYQLCSKKFKLNDWKPDSRQSPPCIRSAHLSIPFELEIPINVESIIDEDPVEKDQMNEAESIQGVETFDGPENLARVQSDYYQKQVSVGDLSRAKRVKRMRSHNAVVDKSNDEQLFKRFLQSMWNRS